MSASINDNNQVKEWLIEIVENAEPKRASKSWICRVPRHIRRMNVDAYTPQLISIGPLHYGKSKLADMEIEKIRYVKHFFDGLPPGKCDEIITFIQMNEQRIRNFYAEAIELEGPQFLKMIIHDAVFIIQHFLGTILYGDDGSDPLHTPKVKSAVSMDLILHENQLPYFILHGIYNMKSRAVTFLEISNRFFRYAFDLDFDSCISEPKHFTDLIRTALVESSPKVELKGPIRDLPCAMKLHESGLKFRSSRGRGLFDIRLVEKKVLVPWFKVQELHIPCFSLYDSTERLIRNLMALEQCHYPSDTRVCNYVRFMDYLINNEKDVELLVAGGVISDVIGNNVEIAIMFNKLGSHLNLDEESCYHNICKELRVYYQNPSNWNKASLKNVYFSNIWTGTATIAAGILLLLTVIQAICSIVQLT